jgi:ABC-type antimicrobial peptide transport system, ATPase component
MYSVELDGVTKRYPGGGAEPVVALDAVDFAAAPGEFVAVVGPSGSGKSTLLNVLGLLDDPTEGRRLLSGTDVTNLSVAERTTARKESIGFVFQDFSPVADAHRRRERHASDGVRPRRRERPGR